MTAAENCENNTIALSACQMWFKYLQPIAYVFYMLISLKPDCSLM